MICSIVIFFCFSVYGICLMVLNDRTLWKVLCCIIGLLYAVIIQIIIHTGKENVMILPDRKMQERGLYWLDQMPITLKACFSGSFSLYFEDKTVMIHCTFII